MCGDSRLDSDAAARRQPLKVRLRDPLAALAVLDDPPLDRVGDGEDDDLGPP